MSVQPPSAMGLRAGPSSPVSLTDSSSQHSIRLVRRGPVRTLLRNMLRKIPCAVPVSVMSILTILVFGLALDQRDALWLWVAFVCALISGCFMQALMARNK